MRRPVVLTAALLLAIWVPVSGRAPEPPLVTAAMDWERGDYIAALTRYLQILNSQGADADTVEEIALRTGELFHTIELSTDGATPIFSPDARLIVYETGAGIRRQMRVVQTSAPAAAPVEIAGWGAAFSPDSRQMAFLRVEPSDELRRMQAAADTAEPSQRGQALAALNQQLAHDAAIVVRDMTTGRETAIDAPITRKTWVAIAGSGAVLTAGTMGEGPIDIYSIRPGQASVPLTSGEGDKVPVAINAPGTAVLFTVRTGAGGRGGGRGGQAGASSFGVIALADGTTSTISGSAPSFSADGASFTFVAREGSMNHVRVASLAAPAAAASAWSGPDRVDAPALSPDGSRVVFQRMLREDWELFVVNRDGSGETRLTREIQHDVVPRFLTPERLLGLIGEPRHRRSYLYDVVTGHRTRLFHNNTVRTIVPEYGWVASGDGTKVLIVADRDGDTVSPERGVYLVDLTRRVTRDELRARLQQNLEAEKALHAHGLRVFAPIAEAVRRVVAEASVDRVYAYSKALYDFDSKHISQPGNDRAAEYLFNTYQSFGYEPEYQWFDARAAVDGKTANVLATLRGTVNPELVYIISSHYDSVAVGPGADDDSSGTAALLETARILAKHPQAATIVFASFTGEESGLLGSREWVRQAVANEVRLVGALNNDMIGWANDQRLDNTIRYSNDGIRDIQHGAAMHFTKLITYDAKYYRGTDAAAYYEVYGDIVGGIGSYPVLGNPHYHQPHDVLETINHQLVTEVAKTTAATIMLLASSPSRLDGLKVDGVSGNTTRISWTPSPEKGVTGYIVAYGPPANPEAQRLRVTTPNAALKGAGPGTVIAVKAVNDKGLEGWDWARVDVR